MDAINEYKEFSKLLESAKKGINPNCKDCGGTGYDSHPNHMTTYPICLSCEAWVMRGKGSCPEALLRASILHIMVQVFAENKRLTQNEITKNSK